MKIDLTEKELTNLQAFLSRAQLSGAEVPAYIEIQMKLNNPIIEKVTPIHEVEQND